MTLYGGPQKEAPLFVGNYFALDGDLYLTDGESLRAMSHESLAAQYGITDRIIYLRNHDRRHVDGGQYSIMTFDWGRVIELDYDSHTLPLPFHPAGRRYGEIVFQAHFPDAQINIRSQR